MEDKIKISILLQIYGNLLTEKQFALLDDYYNKDLSLTEIAENESITRQAVKDFLKKGEKKLLYYEEKLQIMKKNNIQEQKISNILYEISKIENNIKNRDLEKIIKNIKNQINTISII